MALSQILGSLNSPLRRALLHYAVRRKQAELLSGIVRNNSFWDKLLFNKIQVIYAILPHLDHILVLQLFGVNMWCLCVFSPTLLMQDYSCHYLYLAMHDSHT